MAVFTLNPDSEIRPLAAVIEKLPLEVIELNYRTFQNEAWRIHLVSTFVKNFVYISQAVETGQRVRQKNVSKHTFLFD